MLERLKKISKFLLILVVATSWIFSGWPQIWQNPSFPPQIKITKAATIPSGVIIAWPSTAASIPSGWTRVTALDTYFLEGTTVDPSATAGGNATHTHTSPTHTHTVAHTHAVPAYSASATTTTSGTSTGAARSSHTHATSTSNNPSITNNNAASANFGTASNDPPNLVVIWIQSDGTPTGIPNGADVWFNSDTLPGSWTRVAGNRFLKGAAAAGDGGGTGGSSDSHTHTDSGHTHTEATHTHTGTATLSASTTATGTSTSGTVAINQHTHPLTSTSVVAAETSGVGVLANADGQPPFYKLNVINNGTGGASLPNNIIAAWTGTIANIPSGWILCDGSGSCPNLNDKFIKGANADSEIGTTGGALTHTHGAGAAHSHTINNHQHTFTTGAQTTGNVTVAAGTRTTSTSGHLHSDVTNTTSGGTTGTQTVTADANTDNRPPYKEAAFIMYITTVDTPSFDNGTATYNNDVSVTITVASPASSTICYTTDGSAPAAATPGTCSNGTTYSGPVSITATGTVLKAIGTKAGYTNSAEQSATYTLTVGAITSSPGAGTYTSTQSVTLSIATTTSAVAHYTTDGSAATCSSTTYSGAFDVSTTTTVKAIGCKTNYNSDTAISDLYTIAVISVSVSDGVVQYGTVASQKSTITAADTQHAMNDGNVSEKFNIRGQNTGCPWTLSSIAGNEQYVHEVSTNSGTNWFALSTSYETFYSGVASSSTKDFDLRITVPDTTACYGQQQADVTVQAVQN